MKYAVKISIVHCVEQERLQKRDWAGLFSRLLKLQKKANLMQEEANLCREITKLLPNTPGMCPQVGAFGLVRGIYLRTDHDTRLAQNQKLMGPQSRVECVPVAIKCKWHGSPGHPESQMSDVPHSHSCWGLEVWLVGESRVHMRVIYSLVLSKLVSPFIQALW